VLNAANETAVHAFLDRRIGFLEITETVERTLDKLPGGRLESLDDVYSVDAEARAIAAALAQSRHIGAGAAQRTGIGC
jgi:1-deoxy-D-xylulose-5-phosphate reductoisomerase